MSSIISVTNFDPSAICAICHEALSEGNDTVVDHTFDSQMNPLHPTHKRCLAAWVRVQREQDQDPRCPVCRDPIDPSFSLSWYQWHPVASRRIAKGFSSIVMGLGAGHVGAMLRGRLGFAIATLSMEILLHGWFTYIKRDHERRLFVSREQLVEAGIIQRQAQ